jgi:hypothetical protein
MTKGIEMNEPLRQGDILLIPVPEIPTGLAKLPRDKGRIVLAEGEVTGHFHAIEATEAALHAGSVEDIENRFLAVEAEVALNHPEHKTIVIQPGNYRVVRQRENAEAGGITYVAD